MQQKYLKLSFSLTTLFTLMACNNSTARQTGEFNFNNQQIAAQTVAVKLDTNLGERPAPNEARDIKIIEQHILDALRKTYRQPPVKRDVHAKHHGCPKAFFTVQNQNLPPEARVGVFAQNGKTFPAWIRFSNGSSSADKPDNKGDVRGMAIKLMGVPGKKLLKSEENEQTQDFLLMNNSYFFINKLSDYVAFSRGVAKGAVSMAAFMVTHPFVAARIIKIFSKKVTNPVDIEYFSATPYKLGNNAVKYKVQPCSSRTTPMPANPVDNFLQEEMQKTLDKGNVCYDFMVQFRKGSLDEMPVEDSTKDWEQSKSPYVKAASLVIPHQKFNSKAQMIFCENLSFTPWHSLPEHKPLGAVNRTRKSVYETISRYRHQQNGVTVKEPTDHQIY